MSQAPSLSVGCWWGTRQRARHWVWPSPSLITQVLPPNKATGHPPSQIRNFDRQTRLKLEPTPHSTNGSCLNFGSEPLQTLDSHDSSGNQSPLRISPITMSTTHRPQNTPYIGSSSSSCSSSSSSSSGYSASDSDLPSSSSSSSTDSGGSAARHSMDASVRPPVQVALIRCLRCAKAEEITSTDDPSSLGMVQIGTNIYYCQRCAKMVGYT